MFKDNEVKETAVEVQKKSHFEKQGEDLTTKPTPKSVNWKTNLKKTWFLLPELILLLTKPGNKMQLLHFTSQAEKGKTAHLADLEGGCAYGVEFVP